MAGAFDVPLDVFALDHAGVGTSSPGRVEAAAQQDDGVSPAVVSGPRGENRAPRVFAVRNSRHRACNPEVRIRGLVITVHRVGLCLGGRSLLNAVRPLFPVSLLVVSEASGESG